MFVPCCTDVGTYFRNVLRDVSNRVIMDRHLMVIKRKVQLSVQVVRGVACSFFPTAWDGMLDQTLI